MRRGCDANRPGTRKRVIVQRRSRAEAADGPAARTATRAPAGKPAPRTEGGEALTSASPSIPDGDATVQPRWHALWTASRCERLVHDQLAARGFDVFLPELQVWSRRRGVRRLIPAPMFPGYLFIRHAMDKHSYVEIVKARGLVKVLGERWDRLAAVPDAEIAAVQRLHAAGLPALPHPYLREGQRVRIVRGALEGVEGTLVRVSPGRGLLVVSVHLLQRSVAVQIDCTLVTPVGDGTTTVHGEHHPIRRRRRHHRELVP